MARKPESQYISAVRKLLPPPVYALKLNLPYTAGIPDCWYSGPAHDLWVEFKYFQVLPPVIDLVNGRNPILSSLQQAWLRDRHHEGRKVCVIVGAKAGAVVFENMTWLTPLPRSEFLARAKPKKDIALWLTKYVSGLTVQPS